MHKDIQRSEFQGEAFLPCCIIIIHYSGPLLPGCQSQCQWAGDSFDGKLRGGSNAADGSATAPYAENAKGFCMCSASQAVHIDAFNAPKMKIR